MRIVTVTNQKGGVGKTTLVCHLALAGVERGLRTLVVDLDTQGNASTMLARTLVKPIRMLQDGAARIGAGDLEHRIEGDTREEVQALGW